MSRLMKAIFTVLIFAVCASAGPVTIRIQVDAGDLDLQGALRVDVLADGTPGVLASTTFDESNRVDVVLDPPPGQRLRLALDLDYPRQDGLSFSDRLGREVDLADATQWPSSIVLPADLTPGIVELDVDMRNAASFRWDSRAPEGGTVGFFTGTTRGAFLIAETLLSAHAELSYLLPLRHEADTGPPLASFGVPADATFFYYVSTLAYLDVHNAALAERFEVGPFPVGPAPDTQTFTVADRTYPGALGILRVDAEFAYFNDADPQSWDPVHGPLGLCLVDAATGEVWHVHPGHDDLIVTPDPDEPDDRTRSTVSFDGTLNLPPGVYDVVPISLTGVFQWFPSILETRQPAGVAPPTPGVPRVTLQAGSLVTLGLSEADCSAILDALADFDDAYRATVDHLPVAASPSTEDPPSSGGDGDGDGDGASSEPNGDNGDPN